MRRALAVLAASLVAGAVSAQSPDPFTLRPPGGQAPNPQGAMNIESLTRQGFEIRTMERASDRTHGFVVLLQRAGEFRTCLMRIERDQAQGPRVSSLCF